MNSDFVFEYIYEPSSDAEERLAEVWDLIFAMLLEDLENEQETPSDGEPC